MKLRHYDVCNVVVRYAPNHSAVIVDLGAGWGQLAFLLRALDYQAFCYEANLQRSQWCTYHGLNCVSGPIRNIPFPDRYADVVVCMEVLEHLNDEEYEQMLQQINRIIKPEGTIILSFPDGPHALQDAKHVRIVEVQDVLSRLDNVTLRETCNTYKNFEYRKAGKEASIILVLQRLSHVAPIQNHDPRPGGQ